MRQNRGCRSAFSHGSGLPEGLRKPDPRPQDLSANSHADPVSGYGWPQIGQVGCTNDVTL